MARNTKVQQFRDTAVDEQWQAAVADHDMLTDEEFKAKYGFSWNAILQNAVDKGFYQKKRNYSQASRSSTPKSTVFFIPSQSESFEKVSCSVQLTKQMSERLKNLQDDNRQYTHFSILNQLLDEALQKYGY